MIGRRWQWSYFIRWATALHHNSGGQRYGSAAIGLGVGGGYLSSDIRRVGQTATFATALAAAAAMAVR